MKGFIINLDRDHDRLKGTCDILDRLGIESVRVPAVDGSQVPQVKSLNAGEIGCLYSHRLALSTFLQTGDQEALIFEDDISCDLSRVDFRKSLDIALRHMAQFDIIYFGKCYCECSSLGQIEGSLYATRGALCLHAYMVSRESATRLLDLGNGEINANLDNLYKSFNLSGKIKCAVFHPSLIKQNPDKYGSHLRSKKKATVNNIKECSGRSDRNYWWIAILLFLIGISLFKYFY